MSYPTYNMYVVSGSVEWARAIIRVTLTLSLLSANTQVDIISFLWVARTKNFPGVSIQSGNQSAVGQWDRDGRRDPFLRPKEDDQICISQLNY